jgi:hypothetical protein
MSIAASASPQDLVRRPRQRDGARALVASATLVLLFALGIYFGGGIPLEKFASASQRAPQDDNLTTGSILFVPVLGNRCRQRLIENATWRIRDGGVVDCETALSRPKSGGRLTWSAARVDVVREGFRQR